MVLKSIIYLKIVPDSYEISSEIATCKSNLHIFVDDARLSDTPLEILEKGHHRKWEVLNRTDILLS